MTAIIAYHCFVLALYGVSVYIFFKCRKLSYNVRFWVIHIQLTTFLRIVLTITRTLSLAIDSNDVGIRLFDGLDRTFMHATFLSTNAMGADRLISLIFPVRYLKVTSTSRLRCYMALIYTISVLTASTVFIGDLQKIKIFGRDFTTVSSTYTTSFLLFGACICTVVLFSSVGVVALKKGRALFQIHGQRTSAYSSFLRLTMRSFALVVMYLLGILPFITLSFKYVFGGKDQNLSQAVIMVVIVLFNISMVLQPILYMAIFYESRARLLVLFCVGQKAYKEKILLKCKQHYASYDIFVAQRSWTHRVDVSNGVNCNNKE